MEDILLKRPESLSRIKKYLIFTSAAVFQIVVFVVLCLMQYRINKTKIKTPIFSPYNTLPDIALMVFNLLSTAVILSSVKKLDVLCRAHSSFTKSKLVVGITLAIFILFNITLILSVLFGYIYV